jgi:hypothetical protein
MALLGTWLCYAPRIAKTTYNLERMEQYLPQVSTIIVVLELMSCSWPSLLSYNKSNMLKPLALKTQRHLNVNDDKSNHSKTSHSSLNSQ